MKTNELAYNKMKNAKPNHGISVLLGAIGGGLIGGAIGSSLDGSPLNWNLLITGGGITLLGIPFSVTYIKQAKNAVEIYNNGLNHTDLGRINFNIGLTHNGLGLKMFF